MSQNLIPCRRVGPSQMRGWPGIVGWAAYLLIPASMHTSLREPHTHLHARMPSVWLLIFLVLFYLPARSRLRHRYSFSARGRQRHGQDKKNS